MVARAEGGINRDHLYGRQSFDAAEAYTWIRRRTDERAVIQDNPDGWRLEPGLYADRRWLAMGYECDVFERLPSGGDQAAGCKAVKAAVRPLFAGPASSGDFSRLCRAWPLNYVIVQSDDPVWAFRSSWVWQEQPVFANSDVRVFPCSR